MRTRLSTYIANARPMVVLTAPFIYALIVPLVLLDLCQPLPGGVLSGLWHREGAARRLHDLRPAPSRLSQRHRKVQLRLLLLRQRIDRLCARDCRPDRAAWCQNKHARRAVGAHAAYARFEDYGDAEAYRALQEGAASPESRMADGAQIPWSDYVSADPSRQHQRLDSIGDELNRQSGEDDAKPDLSKERPPVWPSRPSILSARRNTTKVKPRRGRSLFKLKD